MTENERDAIQARIEQAIQHIEKAVGQLEALDRIKFIDVSDYLERLYEVGSDLELEALSMEDEVITDE